MILQLVKNAIKSVFIVTNKETKLYFRIKVRILKIFLKLTRNFSMIG